jgi:hypothetical protein
MNTETTQPGCQKPAHTPTPWRVEKTWDKNKIAISGGEWAEFAIVYVAPGCEIEANSNAAHIVKCVNENPSLAASNKALREALEKCLRALEFHDKQAEYDWHESEIAAARAALSESEAK